MKFKTFLPSMILISGPTLTLTSSSSLQAWSGSESTLLGFLPFMSLNSESMMKYFLIQTLGSTMFLASIFNYPPTFLGVTSALALKLAAAPMHSWLPSVSANLSYPNLFILLTWQKIAPLYSSTFFTSPLINSFIISSALMGTLGSLNQTSFKKILAYSSISHLGWSLSGSSSKWLLSSYLIIYSLNLAWVLSSTKEQTKLSSISQTLTQSQKTSLSLSFLASGGFPPFSGFWGKILSSNFMIKESSFLLLALLLFSSLVNLFIYYQSLYLPLFQNHLKYMNPFNKKIPLILFSLNLSVSLSFFI